MVKYYDEKSLLSHCCLHMNVFLDQVMFYSILFSYDMWQEFCTRRQSAGTSQKEMATNKSKECTKNRKPAENQQNKEEKTKQTREQQVMERGQQYNTIC